MLRSDLSFLIPTKRSHLAGVRTEAAVATASAFQEPATAVGCGAAGTVDQAGKLFGEALVDGVDESGRTVAHDAAPFSSTGTNWKRAAASFWASFGTVKLQRARISCRHRSRGSESRGAAASKPK